ncbi:hypothetical protein Suden_0793 [Sulfurimonas denitrificans DSM 1251]|uniref:Uncharacterized protein n=1 Tax=Sulfurimonas denitrificans (strain ATCC 33889 / DSM 1251) TaxID=326298 RepID=Q30SF9_SULDN|nr:hypothetical protein [Sulfurimonas denitrificans]ABB44072.1 hypothetical protein Suden_0793 [Sulfurimonas denitrificans DSM 1251]MDD3441904.1 hypothetical protein [Sulfurimonas denitrificans]
MPLIPENATKIEVLGATVDFFKLEEDGQSTYYFDTSKCGPPDPMVNAVSGLKLIKGTKDKLVMINHKTPGGLFAKLGDDISHKLEETDNGLVKVTFSSNESSSTDTNLQNITH